MNSANPFSFGNNYAGGEGSLDFFDDYLEIKGAGILLWTDTSTSDMAYDQFNPVTYTGSTRWGAFPRTESCPCKRA